MRYFKPAFIILLFSVLPLAAEDICGGPVAINQIEAFTLNLSTTVSHEKQRALLEKLSTARVEQLRLLLEPFSEQEQALLAKTAQWPPYLVTRLSKIVSRK